jgi:hypothetical protein
MGPFTRTLSIATVFVASSLVAQVSIIPAVAKQGYDPKHPSGVHIVERATGVDTILTQITVHNYTTKTVNRIDYGWKITSPNTCPYSIEPVIDAGTATVDLDPAKEVTIDLPESLSGAGTASALGKLAAKTKAPVVLVEIGLLRVRFADGSEWTDKEAIEHATYDNGLAEETNGCAIPKSPAAKSCGFAPISDGIQPPDVTTCVGRWCNPWMIYLGNCEYLQCDIYCPPCTSDGCGACYGNCDASYWPWNCSSNRVQ